MVAPRALLAMLCLAAAALAGCSDNDPSSGGESPGLSTDGTDPAHMHPAPSPTIQGAPMFLAIEEDGSLPACAGSPTTAMAPCAFVAGDDRWFRQDIEGTVLGANLTLTWDAALPTTEELQLTFTPIKELDGGGETFTGDPQTVNGPSPLALDLADLGWKGGMYTVAIWWSGDATAAAPQEFHVSGGITYAPDVPAPPRAAEAS